MDDRNKRDLILAQMSIEDIRAYMKDYDEIWLGLNGYSPLAFIIHNLLNKITWIHFAND